MLAAKLKKVTLENVSADIVKHKLSVLTNACARTKIKLKNEKKDINFKKEKRQNCVHVRQNSVKQTF